MRKGIFAALTLLLGVQWASAQPLPPPNYSPLPPQFQPQASRPAGPVTATPVQNPGALGKPVSSEGAKATPQLSAPTSSVPVVEGMPQPYQPYLPVESLTYGQLHRDLTGSLPKEATFDPGCREKCWISGDYLGAWFKTFRIPTPLVTLGSAADLNPGALGQPGTRVLFGGNQVDFGYYHGFRGEVGMWLDEGNYYSIDAGGFFILPQHEHFFAASNNAGLPVLARPIVNVNNGLQEALITSLPGTASGSVAVDLRSQLFGYDANIRRHFLVGRRLHCEALTGFRSLHLEEDLKITDRLQPLGPGTLSFRGNAVDVGSVIADEDRFNTANRFYGWQLGGRVRCEMERVSMDFYTKTSVGISDQSLRITGMSSLNSPGGNESAPGGILALPSNIGDHSRKVFTAVPEVGVNLGVDLTSKLRARAGYSFLLWTNVLRPGTDIDPVVNPGLIPTDPGFGPGGPARPAFKLEGQVFWVHSFSVGLELHY